MVAPADARDKDRDGMADAWERRHHVFGARADADKDGLTNRYEFRRRTHPRRADTDRDGLRDADEFRYGWAPRKRDTDGDGVLDGGEGAGRVETATSDSLVIRLADGGTLQARIGDDTVMICPPTDYGDEELDTDSEAGYDDSEPTESSEPGGILEEDDADDELSGEPFIDRCVAYFKPGALVHEATARDGVFAHLALVG